MAKTQVRLSNRCLVSSPCIIALFERPPGEPFGSAHGGQPLSLAACALVMCCCLVSVHVVTMQRSELRTSSMIQSNSSFTWLSAPSYVPVAAGGKKRVVKRESSSSGQTRSSTSSSARSGLDEDAADADDDDVRLEVATFCQSKHNGTVDSAMREA